MTDLAWMLLGAAAGFAVGDWVALVIGRRSLELVCKPAATMALIGLAVALDPASSDRRAVFVAALVFSLAGDVFLMFDRFLPGLASFLVAQLTYTAGFAIDGGSAESTHSASRSCSRSPSRSRCAWCVRCDEGVTAR